MNGYFFLLEKYPSQVSDLFNNIWILKKIEY
jgi:hypothetical protein